MCINIHTHTHEWGRAVYGHLSGSQNSPVSDLTTCPEPPNDRKFSAMYRNENWAGNRNGGSSLALFLTSVWPSTSYPTEPQFPWWRSRENNIYLRRLEWELKWKKPNAHFLPFFLREGGKPVPPSALGQAPWSPKRLAHNVGRFHDVPRAVRSGPSKATHVLWDTFLN